MVHEPMGFVQSLQFLITYFFEMRPTVSGTFENDFFGIPATGKKAAWKGVNIYRFESGKIVEALWHKDMFTMLQQFGVIPTE
jgi:predicted ester cyclase